MQKKFNLFSGKLKTAKETTRSAKQTQKTQVKILKGCKLSCSVPGLKISYFSNYAVEVLQQGWTTERL